MDPHRMVRVTTVPNAFQARVVAARLGSEGIVWELRGNVDGPYPVGAVEVFVPEEEHAAAVELLEADAAAFEDEVDDEEAARPGTSRELWFVVAALVAVLVFTLVRLLAQA